MAKYEAMFTLILTEEEVNALRNFLGNMTGEGYMDASDGNVVTKDLVTGIYRALPEINPDP